MTQSNAVATTDQRRQIQTGTDGSAQDLMILEAAVTPHGLRRHVSVIMVPPDYQYKIPRRELVNGQWTTTFSVGLTIDGYDYINRSLGATFFLPEYVHDENDQPHRNPIHRKDYIYLRMGAVWYTPLGQLVSHVEDVEVDFRLAYMESRVSAKSADPVLDEAGFPMFAEDGAPMVKLSKDDELKALRQFATSRNFGPRYAQSVARVRLLKIATGLRSLPIAEPAHVPVKIVGFTDDLTPQQRVEKAGETATSLYGRPDTLKPLSAQEMEEAGIEVHGEEDIDRGAVTAAIENEQEAAAPQGAPAAEPAVAPAAAVVDEQPIEQGDQQGVWDDGLPGLPR